MMNFAKFAFLFAVLAILFACGEVEVDYQSSSGSVARGSSSSVTGVSSSGNSNCIPIEMDLNWRTPSDNSYVHGSTSITLSPFKISRYLITQGQYKAVMGDENPSGQKGDALPVYGANWHKAVEFGRKLSEKLCLEPDAIRLPTEAEWEYSAYPLAQVIELDEDYWEWTNDCFDSDFPYNGQTLNPSGPPNCLPGQDRVRKGFGHLFDARFGTDPNCGLDCFPVSFRVIWKQ